MMMKKYLYNMFISFLMIIPIFYNSCGSVGEIFEENSGSLNINGPTAGFSGLMRGSVQTITTSGHITGWAQDYENPELRVNVHIYVEDPNVEANKIATVRASERGLGKNDGSFFKFQLPPHVADGTQKRLFIYVERKEQKLLLTGSQIFVVAAAPKASGQLAYNAGFRNTVQNVCMGCHSFNYEQLHYQFLQTPPWENGTATNNRLINKLRNGHNGVSCNGDPTQGPCEDLGNWWRSEFE